MKQFRQIISISLAFMMLFSCAEFAWAEAEDAASEGGTVLNDGTPWVDYRLRENLLLVKEDPSASKDDFYLRVNYNWLKSAEIAPGEYRASTVDDVSKHISDLCLDVLNDASLQSKDALTAQHLYRAFLDWDARDALGVTPIQETLDRIGAVSSLGALTELLTDKGYSGSRFFKFDVTAGMYDPDTWILYADAMDLLLSDSAEYRERTAQCDLYEAAYLAVMPKMLERFGYSPEEASGMTVRAFALEAELADSILTRAEKLAPDYSQRINNEMSRAEAEKLCSAFPWLAIMDQRGFAGAQRFLVLQPAYLKKLDALYREDRLEDLKNYLIVKTVKDTMGLLDRESFELLTEISNRVYGIDGSRPDEEIACEQVRSGLPTQMSRAFFEKHDPSKMKADITRICEEAISFYRSMLSEEDWLTEETRAKAIEKLDAMTVIAVEPEKWPDYSGLSLDGLGWFDCLKAIGRYKMALSASLADQPVDRDLWYWTSDNDWANDILTTNAGYDPSSNTMVIFRGILEDPFYREDMSDEELYGAIGMIIGHEISHAFDPAGAQYDARGRLAGWWTEADEAAFSERAEKLIDYYDGITVFGGAHVSGRSVQGEAIADMGGVKCMLRLLEQKKEAVDYPAFFEAFARCWCELLSQEAASYYLHYDPHPPKHIRINTVVQQFSQFHEAYGITENDGMFLAPEDRVQVW